MGDIFACILAFALLSCFIGCATLPFTLDKIAKELGEIKDILKNK